MSGDDLISEAITEHWGERCDTKDTDDFPEVAGKTEGRCPTCLAWEQYDVLAALKRENETLREKANHLVNNPGWGTVNYTDGDMWKDADALRAALSGHTETGGV